MEQSDTIQLAYDLNNPMHAFKAGKNETGQLSESYSLVYANKKNILLETVKEADDSSGIIVRGYECHNRLTNVEITLGFSASKAFVCNLMEEKLVAIPIVDGKIQLTVKPFEIFSLFFEK